MKKIKPGQNVILTDEGHKRVKELLNNDDMKLKTFGRVLSNNKKHFCFCVAIRVENTSLSFECNIGYNEVSDVLEFKKKWWD